MPSRGSRSDGAASARSCHVESRAGVTAEVAGGRVDPEGAAASGVAPRSPAPSEPPPTAPAPTALSPRARPSCPGTTDRPGPRVDTKVSGTKVRCRSRSDGRTPGRGVSSSFVTIDPTGAATCSGNQRRPAAPNPRPSGRVRAAGTWGVPRLPGVHVRDGNLSPAGSVGSRSNDRSSALLVPLGRIGPRRICNGASARGVVNIG
jgi:hypothetical protein